MPDHNRTVITFVGAPDPVEQAAFLAIKKAAELIDLDVHEGEHPRIGATDVCPFIPVKGISMDQCVGIARRLGERVGEELGIAVYLYGAAATRPERARLAAIRKGEYELWKMEVATNPDRRPDFGPAEAKPWGATVIGARPFLIAYNLYPELRRRSISPTRSRAISASAAAACAICAGQGLPGRRTGPGEYEPHQFREDTHLSRAGACSPRSRPLWSGNHQGRAYRPDAPASIGRRRALVFAAGRDARQPDSRKPPAGGTRRHHT